MPRIHPRPLVVLYVACALGAAAVPDAGHAQGRYDVSFQLQMSEQFARVRALGGPATVAWMTSNSSTMTGLARDQTGLDTTSGAPIPVWTNWGGESDYEHIEPPIFVDGRALNTTFVGYVPGGNWAFASMSISANLPATGGEVHVEGLWWTQFEILPGQSAPIPGVARLVAPGAPALAGASWVGGVDAATDSMSWSLQSAAYGVGITFSGAMLQPLAPGLDVFTATPGADGRLEIRVSNPTDQVIAGRFSARTSIDASYVNLGDVPVSPVPEAPVWALQLLACGLMGTAWLRQRRRRPH